MAALAVRCGVAEWTDQRDGRAERKTERETDGRRSLTIHLGGGGSGCGGGGFVFVGRHEPTCSGFC